MMLFIVSFIAFGLAMAFMALGVSLGRPPLYGSCGRNTNCDCGRDR
jgi:hypothetical protein